MNETRRAVPCGRPARPHSRFQVAEARHTRATPNLLVTLNGPGWCVRTLDPTRDTGRQHRASRHGCALHRSVAIRAQVGATHALPRKFDADLAFHVGLSSQRHHERSHEYAKCQNSHDHTSHVGTIPIAQGVWSERLMNPLTNPIDPRTRPLEGLGPLPRVVRQQLRTLGEVEQDRIRLGEAPSVGPFQQRNPVIGILLQELGRARLALEDVELDALERKAELGQKQLGCSSTGRTGERRRSQRPDGSRADRRRLRNRRRQRCSGRSGADRALMAARTEGRTP